MKNIKLYLKTICCFCLLSLSAKNQTLPNSVSFKTPEVAAFNHFIETPVSLYTGVPSISIPLYEINIKGVTVPIKLNYHAGGIRVDQDATWVGLGWSLDYGGEISRKTKGIPDEYYYFYGGTEEGYRVNHFMQLPNVGSSGWNYPAQYDRVERISLAKRGGSDYMPDEFYYSTLGYSGRFMFSQAQNKFLLFPKEDIGIQKFDGPTKLYVWNMKLPDGISIDFGRGACTKQEMSVMNLQTNVANSWQIKAVKNNYGDSISYEYDNFSYRLPKISGQQFSLATTGIGGSTNVVNPMLYDSRIKTISFPNGRIEFSVIEREDMPNQALSEIVVYDNANSLVKKIRFNYSYFYGNALDVLATADPYYASRIPDGYRYKRLRLDSVSIGAQGLQPITYAFDYYTNTQMPSKYSFAQDHWGFYNGIANMSIYGYIPNLDTRINGGDRRVKPENSNVFSLKSITYPEGGKSEFIYENNMASAQGLPNELLASYQDDNFIEKEAAITVSSDVRSTSRPEATETINGVRYFRKIFTVEGGGYATFGNNWSVYTNFGISPMEDNAPYLADNVEFKLERIENGNRTTVRSFNTTHSDYPYNNAPPRKGQDDALIPILPGNYEMTVAITYLNQPDSPPANQPYNLFFTVKWRELNTLTTAINVGGLRVKDINYYSDNNILVKKKSYSYKNPNMNPAAPNFTSGRIVSLPQYYQYKMKKQSDVVNGGQNIEWKLVFSSSSILPLETTAGSFVGYEYVDEFDVDFSNTQNNLKTNSRFSFVQPYFSQFYPQMNQGMYEPKEWTRGKLLNKSYYKGNSIIKSEDYSYFFVSPFANNTETAEDYVEEINTDFISYQSMVDSYSGDGSGFPEDFYDNYKSIQGNWVYFYYSPFNNTNAGIAPPGTAIGNTTSYYSTMVPYFKRFTGFDKLKTKTITLFDEQQNAIVQTENYAYERTPMHYQLTKTESQSSAGTAVTSENKYPQDLIFSGGEEAARQKLVDNHQLNISLMQTLTKNAKSEQSKTEFGIDPLTGFVMPKVVRTNSLANGDFEERNRFNKFDDKGNLLEIQQTAGAKTVYLYSYNKQYPVAEIKNADYAAVVATLGGQTTVDAFAVSSPTDVQLKSFLDPLRISIA